MHDRRPALVLSLVLAACGSAPTADAAHTHLWVASDLDNRPFAWVDEDGVARGRDVEMMERLAREVGAFGVRWARMPFEELLPAAEAGRVDVVCATLGITPERERRVLFTRPYFRTRLAVVTRDGPDEPATLAALAGRRVSAGAGTTSEEAVRSKLAWSTGVFESKSGLPTAELLLAREIDAAVMDGPAAEALVAANPGLRTLAVDLGSEDYGLALPPDRAGLLLLLDEALGRLESSGWLARLDARYGLVSAAPGR